MASNNSPRAKQSWPPLPPAYEVSIKDDNDSVTFSTLSNLPMPTKKRMSNNPSIENNDNNYKDTSSNSPGKPDNTLSGTASQQLCQQGCFSEDEEDLNAIDFTIIKWVMLTL